MLFSFSASTLPRFQLASKQAVIRWLKQGFTLVPEHSGFFPADLKIFSFPFRKRFYPITR
jgi:hypothetical protein